MEETVVSDPNFLQVLITSPATYVIALIVALVYFKTKKSKSSSKCCKPYKTSTPTEPVAKKPVGKKTAPKKTAPKKATKRVAKKSTTKRTPKKGGK